MKLNYLHKIMVSMAAFALLFMAACSGGEESIPDTSEVALCLNVATIGSSRSGLDELLDNEKMKSVRVIVLHRDGTVEHNRHYSLESLQTNTYILLKVRPNENKKIFLFANEESVSEAEGLMDGAKSLTAFFNSYSEGFPGFEESVNGLYFKPDYSDNKPIPMSSMYEIQIPDKGNVEKTFYVVRVATKFTINCQNKRGEDIIVDEFTIAKYADKNFLMAHVSDSQQNRDLFGEGRTWIDWLKEVSDASSENDDYAATEAAGWLKDYELPTNADKTLSYSFGPVAIKSQASSATEQDKLKPSVAETVSEFYLPESISLKPGTNNGEQEYIMTMKINGVSDPFSFTLPNLKALFRNTHVIINISMNQNNSINITVRTWRTLNYEYDY